MNIKFKFYFLFLSLILLALGCYKNVGTVRTDRELAGWIGPVNTVVSVKATLTRQGNEWVEGERMLLCKMVYNKDGNTVEDIRYENRLASMKRKSAYDAGGREIERARYKCEGAREVLESKTVYAYDQKGRLVREKVFVSGDSPVSEEVYSYDQKGNLVESKATGQNGAVTRLARNYQNGKLRSDLYTDANPDGSFNVKSSTVYRGNSIEKGWYNPKDDKLMNKSVARRDRSGKLLEQLYYNAKGALEVAVKYRYNKQGNLIEVQTVGHAAGWESKRETYDLGFDAKGNITKRLTSKWVTGTGKEVCEFKEVQYYNINYFGDKK